MRTAAALAMLAALTGCQPHGPLPDLRGVVSIDYCADQTVLGMLPRGTVRAVSFEADSDASFSAPRAQGLARIRPQVEDIARLRPATVVRSYGGGPHLTRQLEAMGIKVIQLGYAATLDDVRTDVRRVGGELGARGAAETLIARFDAEVAAARPLSRDRPTALYVTPGDVTTGPGSLVADVIGAAGFRPYRSAPGWGSLPLEAMVRRPPDAVFRAFFDSTRYRQDRWSSSRHPAVDHAAREAKDVEVPGAWLSCGNWLTGHAVAALAKAREESR
jgi:iron complex transport system substrate-binding protein